MGQQTRKSSKKNVKSSYGITAIHRAVKVLFAFNQGHPLLSLNEIVAKSQLPKTTVYRILTTLTETGVCELDPDTGKYGLGLVLLRLAEIRRRQPRIRDIAVPVMTHIRDQTTETVVISVRSGDYRVHFDAVEGIHGMRRTADPGTRIPLYVGAASKVLLAAMSHEEIENYIQRTSLIPYQKNTVTSAVALRRELTFARQNGYSESNSELIMGCAALAVPIRDFTGETIAALDVLVPESRYTPKIREKCLRLLLDGARHISYRLGFDQNTVV